MSNNTTDTPVPGWLPASIKRAKERFDSNIQRCRQLNLYSQNSEKNSLPDGVRDDLYRATVVFAHASLDDFLRCIYKHRLGEIGGAAFEYIPASILRKDEDPRKTTLNMSDLWDHRGKRVDELLKASIENHVEKMNVNNSSQVAQLLQRLDIPPDDLKGYFKSLDILFTRRHKIVHRADMSDTGHSTTPSKITAEERENLNDAIRDTIAFANQTFATITKKIDDEFPF